VEQHNYILINNSIGIKKASITYFNEDVNELNEFELATLVIMMRNPPFYNPIRRKKIVDVAVKELLNKKNH